MEVKTLKNVLQTIIHFIDTEKHIDLQNDPWNDLELFLPEFNRFRNMLGLCEYQLEKRMPMTGRGDWFGRGEKVRFVPLLEESQPPPDTISLPQKQKITKTKLEEKLNSTYEQIDVQISKENGPAEYLYYAKNQLVGSWSKGLGWTQLSSG